MGPVTRLPAQGRYLAWEAARLVGVSGVALGQWARRGYIRASVDPETPHVYSFRDVAEAMVVHEMLERGVTHREIRRAVARLGEYGPWPLTDAPIATVVEKGAARVVVATEDGVYDVGDRGWQQVVELENLEAVRSRLHRGGWAVRRLPDLEHIEVHPGRLGGRPTIRGRRIPAEDVAELAAARDGVESLVDGYGLTPEEISDARRWWQEVRRLGAA